MMTHKEIPEQAADAFFRQDYPQALELFLDACSQREEAGLPSDPMLCANLVSCYLALGRLEEARTASQRVLEIGRDQGDRRAEAIGWFSLGQAHLGLGNAADAIAGFTRSISLFQEIGDQRAATSSAVALGDAHRVVGDIEPAIHAYEKALPGLRLLFEPIQLVHLLVTLGGLLYLQKNPHRAVERLDEARTALPQEAQGSILDIQLCGNRALALLAIGRLVDAESDLLKARAGYLALGDYRFAAEQAARLSDLYRYQGDLARAVQFYQEVLELEKTHGFQLSEAGMLFSPVVDVSLRPGHAGEGAVSLDGTSSASGKRGTEPAAQPAPESELQPRAMDRPQHKAESRVAPRTREGATAQEEETLEPGPTPRTIDRAQAMAESTVALRTKEGTKPTAQPTPEPEPAPRSTGDAIPAADLQPASGPDPGPALPEPGGEEQASSVSQLSEASLWLDAGRTAAHPVLLIAPPMHGHTGPLFPRAIACLGSLLEAHDIPVELLPLAHLVDVFADREQVRARTAATVSTAVRTLEPRAVGISIPYTYLYPAGLELARLVRAAGGDDLPIVMGGPHVTFWDRECLAEAPQVDVVVRGEGEWTFLHLLRTLERRGDLAEVEGITWRLPDGQSIRNRARMLGDVSTLPPIDFDLLPEPFCRRMEVHAITSRGCAHRCRFCHERRFWGGKVRQLPVERVVEEMELIRTRFGDRVVGIDDSMLDMRTPYFHELCRRLAASSARPEDFSLLSRIDTITPEGLEAMRRAGVTVLMVGLESGSNRVLQAMNKGYTIEQAMPSIRLCQERGVQLYAFFIVGHPGDNPLESAVTQDLVETLFREELVHLVEPGMFTPYPGSAFYANPSRFGLQILTDDWELWRRTNRPMCQLVDYPAGEIYLSFLRMLEVQARYRGSRYVLI
ncbi:MAG: radical SAM protein [Bradymonadales bacterium]|nr:radical SAM protein [Bradymonadales bacterium]